MHNFTGYFAVLVNISLFNEYFELLPIHLEVNIRWFRFLTKKRPGIPPGREYII